MKNLLRLLREPLFHFIVIGASFFLIYAATGQDKNVPGKVIVVSAQRIDQLSSGYNRIWTRDPTTVELDALIEDEVRAEVYYRDALALGLDRNDTVVRRRLRQKMEFLTDTGVYLKEPASGELEDYYAANKGKYRHAPRLAFEQIFLGAAPDKDRVSRALDALQSDSTTDIAFIGTPTRLPAQLRLSPSEAINSVFGEGFFEQIIKLAPGEWVGPVTSAYGVHLVRTLDGAPASMPALDQVYDAVIKDWRADKALAYREHDYTSRRKHYSVEIHRNDTQDKGQ